MRPVPGSGARLKLPTMTENGSLTSTHAPLIPDSSEIPADILTGSPMFWGLGTAEGETIVGGVESLTVTLAGGLVDPKPKPYVDPLASAPRM